MIMRKENGLVVPASMSGRIGRAVGRRRTRSSERTRRRKATAIGTMMTSDRIMQQNMMILIGILMVMAISPTTVASLPPPAYNVTASEELVKLAAIAFCGKTCVERWSCGTGNGIPVEDTLYLQHPITKAAGYVGYNARTDEVVLSYRGTSNWQNWTEDGNFEKVAYFRCPGCLIHAGFYVDWLFFEELFTQKVSSILAKHPSAKIVTTGHSLGAAIAAICAIEMKYAFPSRKVQIHNFGQPRVGNIKLSDHMAEKLDGIYRVVHNKDLVPHLPPDLPGFDYHHPPHEVFFNSDMSSFKVCDATGEDITCSDKFFPLYDRNDHDHYFINISQVKC